MSQEPKPVDVNRLKSMLGGARDVMNKVNEGDYKKGGVQLDNSVTGDDLVKESPGQHHPTSQPQSMGQSQSGQNNVAPRMSGGNPVYKNMESSKMPDNIKKAMMENPIPQMSGPNHTFNLEDVQDMTTEQPKQKKPQVNENIQRGINDKFTVSESALRGIIKDVVKEELLDFMSDKYDKKLTEQTIKKTINTLIKEGKVKTKRKKK